jgi:hypothetical protein
VTVGAIVRVDVIASVHPLYSLCVKIHQEQRAARATAVGATAAVNRRRGTETEARKASCPNKRLQQFCRFGIRGFGAELSQRSQTSNRG